MIISKIPQFTEEEIQRFLSKIDIQDEDKCWNWTASTSTTGYGQWVRGKKPNQKSYRSHRISYFLYHGIDPAGQILCHTCQNILCCNPLHVYAGSHTDNMYDALEDGARGELKTYTFHHRWGADKQIGSKHPNAKLDEEKVRDIRERLRRRETHRSIAALYGVSRSQIAAISTGYTWKHVD